MNNKAHLRPKDFDSNGDIIPMACKEEKGDLISREALKKAIQELEKEPDYQHEGETWQNGLYAAETLIDNAPTVPFPAFKAGYKQAIIDGKTNFSRPKGAWINTDDFSEWLKKQTTGFDYNNSEVLVDRNGIWEDAIETYLKERSEEE